VVAGKIGPYAAAGLRLALFAGARSGEITAAQWPHVDWQRKLIRLPYKTNEARTIHLSDAAIEVLRSLPHFGSHIVAGRYKNEPHQNLSRAWIIARAYGGLDDVRLHDLRHSNASLAAGRGISLHIIALRSASPTRSGCWAVNDRRRNSARKLPSRDTDHSDQVA
jgi:integrase